MEALDPRRYSVLNILRLFSTYLLARLRANPLLSDLVTASQQTHDAVYAAWQNWWTEAQVRQAALSVRDTAVYRLNAALRNVRAAVQGSTHNDRLSTMYQALFPNGYDDIIRCNPQDKIVLVRKILSLLAGFNDPNLASQTAALQAAADAYDKDAAALDEATAVRQAAEAALEVARQAYCVHYVEIYHRLVVMLGSSRLANTYFRPGHHKVASTDQNPSQPSSPTEPATPAQPAMPVQPNVPAPAAVPTSPVISPQPATSTEPTVPPTPASGQAAASSGPDAAGESNADEGRRAA